MPSVKGLIEERELVARERVESLRDEVDRLVAALWEVEATQGRLVIAKETVSQVLSESGRPAVAGLLSYRPPSLPGRPGRSRPGAVR
ncbi:hypothetical protein [Streptomyces smyrnaeus]|uniref:Uncharacterized protein n=1 Tax=Streptomyces smyrnaeus TaxID=1387713 RepID=A0ABS3XQD5_9ACTN|nr:hypothetical protein [Streptomyces smyrnaeus]MBO8197614.1 hypothetical protein [Streptomyces smyrnaeus]